MERPDYWVILKFTRKDEVYYKVFASFVGGYLDGDSWKMNSGIVKVDEDDTSFTFTGFSGSLYKCMKGCYKTSSYTQQVLEGIIKSSYKVNATIEIMNENTDWDLIEYNL